MDVIVGEAEGDHKVGFSVVEGIAVLGCEEVGRSVGKNVGDPVIGALDDGCEVLGFRVGRMLG